MNRMRLRCKCCGYQSQVSFWSDDCSKPYYQICECCGAESGLDDESSRLRKNYRNEWRVAGFTLFDRSIVIDLKQLETNLKRMERFEALLHKRGILEKLKLK
jgi:hypothetical protein